MTLTAWLDHATTAHDGLTARWPLIRDGWVWVVSEHADGTQTETAVGRTTDPKAWPEAAEACGVALSRLSRNGDAVSLVVTYRDAGRCEDVIELCRVGERAAWRCVPNELFDRFETLAEEWEAEREEAYENYRQERLEWNDTYRRGAGYR